MSNIAIGNACAGSSLKPSGMSMRSWRYGRCGSCGRDDVRLRRDGALWLHAKKRAAA